MNPMSLHRRLEENAGLLIFGIIVVVAIGGLVQLLPVVSDRSLVTATNDSHLYNALELTGRDIYIREGCSVCHTQQVRPLIAEVERYGPYSGAGEFVYDRPFLWGTKRTGPDLHRLGGKYTDIWHHLHLMDPRAVVPESIMPAYPWLEQRQASSVGNIQTKMRVLHRLGHPYTEADIDAAPTALAGLTEMEALIAYLQILGIGKPDTEKGADG